jgi:CubicO group peptidase (beta-lactamase class C family)
MGLSRRNFLSLSAQTAASVVAYKTILGNGSDVVVATTVPNTATQKAEALKPVFAQLDEFIARHMTENGAPGMTLAIANREGPIRISTYGYADTKSGLRVTKDTMFQIGSVSKSFVGLALLQLHDEGKLDLNKPIVEYLPWLTINSKFAPITTHHILSHTAGLPGAPLLLDALLAELWTGYAPGNRFLYSNTGYNILGFLIEALDKRPFADSIRSRLLEPLGMTASSPVISNETRKQMAIGYGPLYSDRPFVPQGTLAEAPWIEMDMSAGSIASTPSDMANYVRMLLNRGALPKGRLLSEDAFNLFIKPHVKSPFRGEDASYGYGLWTSDIDGHTRLRHTGGMVAFSSSIDADITAGIGAFASVNANLRGYRPVAVTRYAIDLINASTVNKPLPAAPPPTPPTTEVKNAGEYAGTYTSPDSKKLVLAAESEKLFLLHNGERIRLHRASQDRFIVEHPAFSLFILGFNRENNRITEAFHGADWYMAQNYTGPKSFETPKDWESFAGHYHSDSPWYGDMRIVMRKGRLFTDGVQRLVPRGDGKFGINDPEAPDWIAFESIVGGRAMRLNLSGIIFRRTFTP